ncbi:YHYH protein [Flavobacteriaceae bacterium]|nr:YHYH protein [Flavobacteriaceae bacterium]
MKTTIITIITLVFTFMNSYAQLSPAITSFLQNNTETGSYYISGNSTAINNNILVNCQQVEYSDNFVYITATGVPAYPTGPFLDGNPSNAQNQNNIIKIPLLPLENTGTPDDTVGGNIGVFINGVALFDYRDGVAWNPDTNSLCGGPGNPPCPGGPNASMDWNRDAIPAEMAGFDCSKGHPAMGNYHHHQNPSAFKLDLEIVSDICNLYDADGLYFIDETIHSPLIGFAFDGFPIYGAYGYRNADGSGGLERIKSGYQLRDITERTHWADGTDVDDGPDVNGTYFLGYFREDYEFISHSEEYYLDEHNGRFCVTPEYPAGTYAYFATVDENWNSAYPYAVGPSFYGNFENRIVTSITEETTLYEEVLNVSETIFNQQNIKVFPNPTSDLIAVQLGGLVTDTLKVELYDASGKLLKTTTIYPGSTIAYFDVQTLYAGVYLIKITDDFKSITKKVIIKRD